MYILYNGCVNGKDFIVHDPSLSCLFCVVSCSGKSVVSIMICFYVGHYDMILLDVDSKDPSMGMSSPPQQFLAKDVLDSMKNLLSEMGKNGINHSKLYCCRWYSPSYRHFDRNNIHSNVVVLYQVTQANSLVLLV